MTEIVTLSQLFCIATLAHPIARGLQVSYARVLQSVNFRETGLNVSKFIRTSEPACRGFTIH